MGSSFRPGRFRVPRALAVPAFALLLLAPAPAPAAVASDLKICTDKAWADYNVCLTQTMSEWERTGCDVGFSTDYALCWARYFGVIKSLLT
ncbi:MAG: hypothetical protein FIB01_14790 [Gemmatimonadetes bacterium]|nr:hypothetical protein [Gemmatimonadota bacterium]